MNLVRFDSTIYDSLYQLQKFRIDPQLALTVWHVGEMFEGWCDGSFHSAREIVGGERGKNQSKGLNFGLYDTCVPEIHGKRGGD